jgi:hypothetical protein
MDQYSCGAISGSEDGPTRELDHISFCWMSGLVAVLPIVMGGQTPICTFGMIVQ